MYTKLKLSHDEMVVLAAIADQQLLINEVLIGIWGTGLKVNNWVVVVESLISKALVMRTWHVSGCLYAIAPEILSLNHPPYSYESWRDLSE